MNLETKKAILAYLEAKDPEQRVVRVTPNADFSGGSIAFSSEMTQHRVETVLTAEKYVEAFLVVKLADEGRYAPSSFELQKEYPAGHPKTDRPRIDVIVNEYRDHAFVRTYLFIEAKDPEKFDQERESAIQQQLYPLADHERPRDLRYLAYFTVVYEAGELIDRAEIIDFEAFGSFDEWDDAGRPTLNLFPVEYGVARKSVYVNKATDEVAAGEKTLNRTAGPVTFAALRNNLHNVLWGGGALFYNDIFTNLIKLFLAKIFDEETTAEGEAYRFQIQAVGDESESPASVYARINGLFKEAQRHYLGYSAADVARFKGIDTEKISEAKVAYVVERLQGLSLVDNEDRANGDVLGDFFEGIVEQGFKQSRGQFFTHGNIVRFLIHALRIPELAVGLVNGDENPAKPRLPYICDPACGSGSFLIQAMKHVTEAVLRSGAVKKSARTVQFVEAEFPPSKPNHWADTYIYGVELNADLALATKVNMVLHGDGNINIYSRDGLADFAAYRCTDKVSVLQQSAKRRDHAYALDLNEQFDVVLSNPPFSITPEEQDKRSYGRRFMLGASAKSENLFLERWYQLLREKGRLGVVLPESVLDTMAMRNTRLFLYRFFRVDAVIALPYLAFKPFTSTKTCLLLATKRPAEEVAAWDRLWRETDNLFSAAVRRIRAWERAETPGEREVVANRLKSDKEEVRLMLGELLGLDQSSAGAISAALYGLGEEPWEEPDRVQVVFSRVANALDHNVFMAEAEDVGYKRRRQGGNLARPNELFAEDGQGNPVVDCGNPQTILEKYLTGVVGEPSLGGFTCRFSTIGSRSSLRCDPKYRWFWGELGGRVRVGSTYEYVPLSLLVGLGEKKMVGKGSLDCERSMIELEDVESGTGRLLNVQLVDEVGSDKLEFGSCDIVFSKLEPYLRKAILNDPSADYIGSSEWVPLVVNGEVALKEYVWWFLLSEAAREAFRLNQSGKRHARIALEDFFDMLVPKVPRERQADFVRAAEPQFERIERLRAELQTTQERLTSLLENSMCGG